MDLKIRAYREGEILPYMTLDGEERYFIPEGDIEYEIFSPTEVGEDEESWDGDEYNLGIILNGEKVRVMNIDFE